MRGALKCPTCETTIAWVEGDTVKKQAVAKYGTLAHGFTVSKVLALFAEVVNLLCPACELRRHAPKNPQQGDMLDGS
jgi:hypothetical protein